MGNEISSSSASSSSSSSIISSSSQETSIKLRETLNLIATQFILSSDFKSLKLLVNETYCDNLTILTKDILSTRFSTKQIKSLAKTDTFFYISKTELARIEAGTRDKKNLMCKQIAKFYVRIAQLFASIITTVYPNWSDTVGPEGKPFDGNDFCQTRIAELTKSIRPDSGDKSKVAIQPTVCSLYANDSTVYAAPGFAALELLYNDIYDETTGTFSKRSGAMQSKYETDLTTLYQVFTGHSSKPPEIKSFSDINISALSKRFKECGPKTSDPIFAPEMSRQELVQTGGQMFDDRVDRDRINRNDGQPQAQAPAQEKSEMEKKLESVQIKAEAKEKSIKAQRENMSGIFSSSNPAVSINSTNGAFSKYAAHIKIMIANAERFKSGLLAVIDKLFLIVKTEAGQPKITIHPALSNEELDNLVNQTRDIIVQLYLGCERDFYTGLKLLRVIIEEKMQENMEATLSALKTETKMAIKSISSKQRIKNENDIARRQDEVNELQQFQNPVFDEEMQKDKADAANDRYNKKKELEYEIKQLEQDKSQNETEKKDVESKIAYYESQRNQLDETSDKTQIATLNNKIEEVTTSLNNINSNISNITKTIEQKREDLRNLQS